MPEEKIETIFPDGIVRYTHGNPCEYRDCQVAKYQLGSFVLELIQPGEGPSPWRAFQEKNGQGAFHFCLQVGDRSAFQQTLASMDVRLPYHVGYHPDGSYSYVNSRQQQGIELSVNDKADNRELLSGLLNGTVVPLDELK